MSGSVQKLLGRNGNLIRHIIKRNLSDKSNEFKPLVLNNFFNKNKPASEDSVNLSEDDLGLGLKLHMLFKENDLAALQKIAGYENDCAGAVNILDSVPDQPIAHEASETNNK